MNKCPNCSRELKTEDNFCPACGFDCKEESIVAKFSDTATYRGRELQPLFRLASKNEPWFKRYFVLIGILIMFFYVIAKSKKEPNLLADWISKLRSAEDPIDAVAAVFSVPVYIQGLVFLILIAIFGNRIVLNSVAAQTNNIKKQTGNMVTEVYEDRIVQKTDVSVTEIQYDSILGIYRSEDGIGLKLKGVSKGLVCLLNKFMTKGNSDELTAFLERKTGCTAITAPQRGRRH